jgi:hypothetical protein
MGANEYMVFEEGPNPQTAFDRAVASASHEYGHGSYSGTIAEKRGDGFRKYQPDPLPLEAARTLASQLMDGDDGEITDKWAPANAIPVAPDSAFRTKRKTLYINTKEEGYLEPVKLTQERLRSATIAGVEVLEDKRRTKVEQGRQVNKLTRSEVHDEFGKNYATVERTLPSCKALAKTLASEAAGLITEFTVHGIIEGEGGQPLASYRQKQISRKVKLRVTYVEQVRRDPAPIGWLFFGYASS